MCLFKKFQERAFFSLSYIRSTSFGVYEYECYTSESYNVPPSYRQPIGRGGSMLVAQVCLYFFDVSLFCITREKKSSLFSRSRVRAVRGASIILRPPSRITFRLRISNRVGEDSCCRGGNVHSRVGCSRERLARRDSPTALWRFRASTSKSPSGRSRLHSHTHIRYIYHICVQQDIRVCGDDHFDAPLRQYPNPKALSLLRVSI